MDTEIIYEKIKKARARRYITNCYTMEVVEKSIQLWEKSDEFLFSYDDHGIKRLVYFAQNWTAVDRLLKLVDDTAYYLEFMTRNPEEYVPDGAKLIAGMMRLANQDCRSVFEEGSVPLRYRDIAVGNRAGDEDTGEIYEILWSTFRTEISHLPTVEELKSAIEARKIMIHRNDVGQIDALLQVEVMPKKFYINQVINRGEKNIIHAILLNRLEEYIACGGKYLYAWVEDKNIASQKFHRKYGMRHDGMWSMIYCVGK